MKKILIFSLMCFLVASVYAQQKIDVQFPKGTLAGKSSGIIAFSEIEKAAAISLTDPTLKVVGFAVTATTGGKALFENKRDNRITDAMLVWFRSLPAGSQFCIDNIVVANNAGRTITLEPLIFKIQ